MPVAVGAVASRLEPTVSQRTGEKMAFMTLEDRTGSIGAVVFPTAYAAAEPLLEADAVVLVEGELDHERGDVEIRADRIFSLE